MNTYKAYEIQMNLAVQWFAKELEKKQPKFIVQVAPKYNYLVNTLCSPDFSKEDDIEVLTLIANMFDAPFLLEAKGYTTWREGLFQDWLDVNEQLIYTTSVNNEETEYALISDLIEIT